MPAAPRIILVSHVCNARNITGAEKLLLFLAKKLSPHMECIILAPREGRLTSLANQGGIRTLVQDFPLLYNMCTPNETLIQDVDHLCNQKATSNLKELFKLVRPDYVFVNTSINVVPAIAAKSLGIPVIWHITETIATSDYQASTVEIVNRYSDLIIGISETTIAPYQSSSANNKLMLLYPSWEEQDYRTEKWLEYRDWKRREWGIAPDEKVIGYISSFLIPSKGPDHFIQAMTAVAREYPKTRFVVIGGEMDRDFYLRLQQITKDSGRSNQYVFVDHVDHVEAAYCAMDIAVIPSLVIEGFGMTAMEAMVCGKPVIAYASGGLHEIMVHTGNEDCTASSGSQKQLADQVIRLLADPEKLVKKGIENREQIQAVFGPTAHNERLLAIVHRMAALPPPNDDAMQSGEGAVPPSLPVRSISRRRRRRKRIRASRKGKRLKRRLSRRRRVIQARHLQARRRNRLKLRRALIRRSRSRRRKRRVRM